MEDDSIGQAIHVAAPQPGKDLKEKPQEDNIVVIISRDHRYEPGQSYC
jgi:hypothetical protein